ncbi:MAG: alkaline phosphatase family protein [Candidatus Acidiferrales bacterium]
MSFRRQISIVVLIDALGWKYMEGRPFLDHLLPYRDPVRTILGFSSGAIPTILTGQLPVVTGHWNLLYYDPKNSSFRWARHLGLLPESVLEHRVTRRIITEVGRKVLSMGPSFECCVSPRLLPCFDWVEKKNIYAEGGVSGAPSIFDDLARQRIPYRSYSYHDFSDADVLRRAEADLKGTNARFLFVYLSEMDMFLHLHCHEPEDIANKLRWYESELSKLFRVARSIDADACLSVISDHGMAPVRNHYDLIGQLEPLRLRMPEDYLAVFDSTMARFWFFNEDARRAVIERLSSLPCGSWLSDDELAREGVLFADRRFGEAIFLLDPGWLLSRSDFNGAGWMPKGMHGYHPDDSHSNAILLTNYVSRSENVRTIAGIHGHMSEAIRYVSGSSAEPLNSVFGVPA